MITVWRTCLADWYMVPKYMLSTSPFLGSVLSHFSSEMCTLNSFHSGEACLLFWACNLALSLLPQKLVIRHPPPKKKNHYRMPLFPSCFFLFHYQSSCFIIYIHKKFVSSFFYNGILFKVKIQFILNQISTGLTEQTIFPPNYSQDSGLSSPLGIVTGGVGILICYSHIKTVHFSPFHSLLQC